MSKISLLKRPSWRWSLLVAAAAVLALASSECTRGPGAGSIVQIDNGRLRGEVRGAVVAFRGIPFARPPVGALRWRPPQPLPAWAGVRDALGFGPDCMQVPVREESAPLTVKSAEDCLYLNVWAPVQFRNRKLPVMVWIYGGAFVNGGTSPAVYDGSAFARDGVVLVSLNYRLGSFGFFAHPALSAEQAGGLLGNYGYMDQIAALQWVQRNVGAFGGDAANVTIFGESVGGVSAHALLTTPLAAGLFERAIIQSGAGRANMLTSLPLRGVADSAEARGLALARSLGVAGNDARALAQLRALPAKTLLGDLNFSTLGKNPNYVGGPIQDGVLNLGWPVSLYEQGRARPLPVIVGANTQDWARVDARRREDLFAPFGADSQAAQALYGPDAKEKVYTTGYRVGGDLAMVEPAREVARLLSAHQPVYEYRFSYVAAALRKKNRGAVHAEEIPYVFDTVAAALGRKLTDADMAAAKAIHAYWVGFARTGVPQASGYPQWPAYAASSDLLMDFSVQGPQVQPDPWRQRLDIAQRFNAAHDASH